MMGRRVLAGVLTGLVAMGAVVISAIAATSLSDTAGEEAVRPSIDVELQPAKAAPDRAPYANPLWGITLESLALTRDRPIFSPSRRAAAPAVVAVPRIESVRPVVRPPEPEHLTLTLVGTVVGSSESIGVFLDEATHNFVRLRTGEQHAGWTLRSIKGRDASLEKDSRTETLSLPAPQDPTPGSGPRSAAGGDPE